MPGSDDLLPPLRQLLTSGGDERIIPAPDNGLNRYGISLLPDPHRLALGATTASPLTAAGLTATTALHERLNRAVASSSASEIYAIEMARLRSELASLYLKELPADKQPDILFAPSGSDAHRLAIHLAAAEGPLQVVAVETAETGSQIAQILAQAPLAGFDTVALREEEGRLRPADEVDADVTACVCRALENKRRVLLILADVSKTGLLAPGPACAVRLRQSNGPRVLVMVDACQLRLAPATVQAYLAQGFMLAMTGSKFMGGPPFSSALLLPKAQALSWRERAVPETLLPHSRRAEWPMGWHTTGLTEEANFGLLLRWQAALTHMAAWSHLPEARVCQMLDDLAHGIHERLAHETTLMPLTVPRLDRQAVLETKGWDTRQTIFPFLLRPSPRARYLNIDEVTALYRELLKTPDTRGWRYQLGQAVSCRQRKGKPAGALRLSLSAPLLLDAAASGQAFRSLEGQMQQALDSLIHCLGVFRRR